MRTIRKRRLYMVTIFILTVGGAVSLILYALNQNIQLYYTPSQLKQQQHPVKRTRVVRLGGMVVKGSVHRFSNSLLIRFQLTDYAQSVWVQYTGELPALFREGQGIVAEGKLNSQGLFIATRVLAKHDEKYMPPLLKTS